MSKKIKTILIAIILIIGILTTSVHAAYSSDVNLSSNSTLEEGKDVEVTLSLENINATSTGISVLKGKITYDTDVFDSYTVETKNGWVSESNNNTFLFEKATGVTTNQEIAIIKFKVKQSISKTEAEIRFSSVTASGIIQASGGPGDIKVLGTTLKISKTATPVIKKEELSVTSIGKNSTTTVGGIMPHAGKEEITLIAILMFSVLGIVMYRRYKNIDL